MPAQPSPCEELQGVKALISAQDNKAPAWYERVPGSREQKILLYRRFGPERQEYARLESRQAELEARNERAFRAYEKQRIEPERGVPKPPVGKPTSIRQPDLASLTAPLIDARKSLADRIDGNYSGKVITQIRDDAWKALPWALGIVLSIVLTPLAIRTFFYFALAPIASRRPALALLPQSSGNVSRFNGGSPVDQRTSSPSCEVLIDEANELLVHPEYLQSSSHEIANDTKWVLNWRYAMTSVAAGLCLLTRMRASTPMSVVLTATRDPLSKVSVVSIPEGSAVVLQPRFIVGVLQPRARPLVITSHWPLGSVHAWLTLQLRYLVIHGPVELIIKGCQGVRIEPVNGGRGITPDATIGFSANLGYASKRTETYMAYLRGKQPLLNDSFVGASGYYICQEMPSAAGRTGGSRRGLEGVGDALLKVLGV